MACTRPCMERGTAGRCRMTSVTTGTARPGQSLDDISHHRNGSTRSVARRHQSPQERLDQVSRWTSSVTNETTPTGQLPDISHHRNGSIKSLARRHQSPQERLKQVSRRTTLATTCNKSRIFPAETALSEEPTELVLLISWYEAFVRTYLCNLYLLQTKFNPVSHRRPRSVSTAKVCHTYYGSA